MDSEIRVAVTEAMVVSEIMITVSEITVATMELEAKMEEDLEITMTEHWRITEQERLIQDLRMVEQEETEALDLKKRKFESEKFRTALQDNKIIGVKEEALEVSEIV